MNKDTERKLDELLAKMPKRDYDLDAWLNEDETAEFDRLQQTNTVLYSQRTNTDLHSFVQPRTNTELHGGKRKVWRWVAAAACLLIIIGVGVTVMLTEEDNMQPQLSLAQPQGLLMQPQPTQAQSLPSPQGEGLGVGSETSKTLALEDEKTILTPPQTPALPHRRFAPQLPSPRNCLQGRGVAAPGEASAKPTKSEIVQKKEVAQASQQDVTADTLGSAIWQREENVVRAVQMLSDCEQTILREEQELRNDIIRATFNATPQPAKARLLLNDNGDYMVVEDNGPVIIAL